MSEDGQNYTMFNSRMLVDTVGDTTDAALGASGIRDVIGVLAGRLFNWGQRKSLFPLHLGIKCCAEATTSFDFKSTTRALIK